MSTSTISIPDRPSKPLIASKGLQITKGELASIVAVLLIFFACGIRNAFLRQFWYDEFSTLFVVIQPTMKTMFQAMPADGNPPMYFLLARLFRHLPLKMELAVRLPSILAFLITSVAIFVFVRRMVAFRFAFLSMCFFLGSNIADRYSVEARGYSLLVMFTALLLLCWQSLENTNRRIWALIGITVCTSCAILSHQYGIVYALVPLFAGEAIRSIRRRAIDFQILLASCLGAITIAFTYPPMLRGQDPLLKVLKASNALWARPGWDDIGLYGEMQPIYIAILLGLVALVWAMGMAMFWPKNDKIDPPDHIEPESLAAADALLLFLPLMVLLTHLGTRYFTTRYAIGSALGMSLVVGVIASYLHLRWRFVNRLAYLGVLYCVTVGAISLWVTAKPNPPIDHGASLYASAPNDEPIVVASALEFVPTWWYSTPEIRNRVHYLSDLNFSKSTADMIVEYSLFIERNQTPMQMEDYRTFLSAHKSFLVYSSGLPRLEWLQDRLHQDGWSLQLLGGNKVGRLYRATAPSPSASRSLASLSPKTSPF